MLIKVCITLLFIHSFVSHVVSTDYSKGVGINDLVVAQDGSGNFRTIQEAINNASSNQTNYSRSGVIIHVKAGVYDEIVRIRRQLKNLTLIGDGIGKTIITGNRTEGRFPLHEIATVGVEGERFVARGITIRNTAGPHFTKAVALRAAADRSVFYNCSIEGYQRTLFIEKNRQFYRDCKIYGTVDFIFGNAAAVFQNSEIVVRKGVTGVQNCITAHGRDNLRGTTGISIHDSKVVPSPELKPYLQQDKTYLGRPWKKYSRTVFMRTYLDSFIDPQGWLPVNGSDHHITAYYGEYENHGPGASKARRIKWPGYHVMNHLEAVEFTVEKFIHGNTWLPSTRVPYNPLL